jgi:8-oxo-dGTP diphosphatase
MSDLGGLNQQSLHTLMTESGSAIRTDNVTDVAVGIIERPDGTLLFGQRPEGKPWSGWWELPGGKLEPGETATQALKRELKEELGIEVTESRPWVTRIHHYPTTTVRLSFHRVTAWQGEPCGLENQALRWLSPAIALQTEHLLPATYPPLKWLTFPEYYAISSVFAAQQNSPSNADLTENVNRFLQKLERGLAKGIKLLQWREPAWPNTDVLHEKTFKSVLNICHQSGARVMVNSVHPQAWWHIADGVHLRQLDASTLEKRPELPLTSWVAVSTHNIDELNHAREIDADFVTLSPVQPTTSHPNAQALGWPAFSAVQNQAGIPVYAMGGLSPNDLVIARSNGAHGVAGISQFMG